MEPPIRPRRWERALEIPANQLFGRSALLYMVAMSPSLCIMIRVPPKIYKFGYFSAPDGEMKLFKPSAPASSIPCSSAVFPEFSGVRPPQKPTSTRSLPCDNPRCTLGCSQAAVLYHWAECNVDSSLIHADLHRRYETGVNRDLMSSFIVHCPPWRLLSWPSGAPRSRCMACC